MPGERILVVDDNADNRKLLGEMLAFKGFAVDTAPDGQSGFEQSQAAPPDVVLMDLNMPDILGIDVCRMIRQSSKTSHIPIIILTGENVSSRDKVWGFRSGADDYLVRPFDMEELVERIHSVLRRGRAAPNAQGAGALTPVPMSMPAAPAAMMPSNGLAGPAVAVPVEAPVEGVDWRRAPGLLSAGLSSPRRYWEALDDRRDYLPSLTVILAAPVLASLSWPVTGQGGFVGWLTAVGLGVIGSLIVWAALSAGAYLVMPFLGADLSWKRVSGILAVASAPKALGALLSAAYALLAATRPAVSAHAFSTGLDLLLSRAPTGWLAQNICRIGFIDLWSAALAVIGLAGVARLGRGGIVKLSFTIGAAWVILGLITAY